MTFYIKIGIIAEFLSVKSVAVKIRKRVIKYLKF